MSSLSFQPPWTSPHPTFYSAWPSTSLNSLNSRTQKRPWSDEENLPSTHLKHWKTAEEDRDLPLPTKKKRRKALSVEALNPPASNVVDLDTGEELFPYKDQPSTYAQVAEPESVVSEQDTVDYDSFLDVRGTCNPSEDKVQIDDGSQNTSSQPLALVLQRPRLPTLQICPSLPSVPLPKNVTSSGRRNRPWSSDVDGMEIDDENETQNAGTMVIYRPLFSLEPVDLDEVAEGVKAMDLD